MSKYYAENPWAVARPIPSYSPAQQPVYPVSSQPQPAAPSRNYTTITSDLSKKTAMLLCVFGGFFGIHYFYVGRVGRGLLYMCTIGLGGFGWIADMISIGVGSFRDASGAPLRQ
jgi:restriction system protein